MFNFKKEKLVKAYKVGFFPKEDITTFELAQCLKYLTVISTYKYFSADEYKSMFEKYPDNVKKHFVNELTDVKV